MFFYMFFIHNIFYAKTNADYIRYAQLYINTSFRIDVILLERDV